VASFPGSGRFGAIVTAMVTPFDDSGALDIEGAVTLARWLADHGSDGLVVAGTTGEGPVLGDTECADLWRAVSEAVTVPVIAGTGTNDTRHSVERTKVATDIGVDAVLVVTPYYNRPSQHGLADHFVTVADSTSLPVLLYDIPVRTGRGIAHDTMLRLARSVSNIVGVKYAAGDVPAAARLVAEAPDAFELYCGDDALALALLSVGAVGVVSVASHWAGVEMGQMVTAFAKGDVDSARALNTRLIESYDFESTDAHPNPLPAKAACRALGLPAGQCRPPLGTAAPELEGEARLVLSRMGRPRGGPGGAGDRDPGAGGPLA
jgi:4-hydroxy-tetrahydrodipicolinate synthase